MPITVYYGIIAEYGNTELNEYGLEPEPVTRTLFEDFKLNSETNKEIYRCPAYTSFVKNIFKVKATFDYNITWDGETLSSTAHNQLFFNKFVLPRDLKAGCLSYLDPGLILFADTDILEVEQLPAIFEKTPIYQGVTIPAGYDIANHFRKLEWAFILNKPQTIVIKPGDALYYIRFKTTEKIVFKRFFLSAEIKELYKAILRYRVHTNKIIPLTWYYDIVRKYYKKKFLKLIKQNLLD